MPETTDLERWLDRAVEVIRAGGIVALAFERLFGLAADPRSATTLARLAAMKGRGGPGAKPISLVLPDDKAVLGVGVMTPLARELAARFWPGPLTLLIPPAVGLPPALVGDRGLVGVRVPGWSPASRLVDRLGLALTATSANLPGAPDPRSHEELSDLLGADLVVPGAVPGPPGSTVVDASGTVPIVLRAGIIDLRAEGSR